MKIQLHLGCFPEIFAKIGCGCRIDKFKTWLDRKFLSPIWNTKYSLSETDCNSSLKASREDLTQNIKRWYKMDPVKQSKTIGRDNMMTKIYTKI